MTSRDLQNCAQLLGHFLDADKTNSAQTHSYLKSLRKEKPVVVKGKSKSKRGRSHVKKQTATTVPPNVDKIDEDIQRMIRIKRAREGHPVLNDKQEQEFPSKDTEASDITAPYNQRLLSSTPQDTPVKIVGKASVSTLLQGDIGEHALNSFEYIRNINPPKESPQPKLKEGQVDYIAHPQKVSTMSRSAFTQEHLEGMRQAYMSCLTESQLRQHQASSQRTTLPSTIPQPVVLSGHNPTVLYPASHIIPPANANVPVQIGSYNLSQNHQNGGIYHVTDSTGTNAVGTSEYNPNYFIVSGSGVQRTDVTTAVIEDTKAHMGDNTRFNTAEQLEKEGGQYSLYSNTTTLAKQENMSAYHENEGNTKGHRTISPFKSDEQREPMQSVSRKDLIKSALKIALDDNGYLKSGPISPFKAGSKGFSSCLANPKEGSFGISQEKRENTEMENGQMGFEREEEEEADTTLVESAPHSRESSPQTVIQQKEGKSVPPAKETGSQESDNKGSQISTKPSKTTTSSENKKTTATKSKKVQFVPSKKKTKDGKTLRKVVNNSKPASSTVESIKAKNAKNNKGKTQQQVKEDDRKASTAKREENKENLQPKDTVSKETVPVELAVVDLDTGKYSGTMKRVQHLVKEVKAVAGIKWDKEGKRLLKELSDTVQTGVNNFQTDFDLALQPIRSENAQLRRKVRILTQQLKDKERELQNAEKPDPNFMVVHLQMKLFNVENEAKSLRATNNKLKEDIRLYLCQLEKLSAERADVMNLFGNKHPDQAIKDSEQGSLYNTQLDAYKRQKVSWDREKDELVHDRQLLQLSLNDKEAELASMQELVRNLQGSMTRLLEDLQTSKPCPDDSVSRLNRELEQVQAIINSRQQARQSQSGNPSNSLPQTLHSATDGQAASRSRPHTRSTSVDRPSGRVEHRIGAAEKSRIKVPERRAVSQQREPHGEAIRLQACKPAHRSATDLGANNPDSDLLNEQTARKEIGFYSREEMDKIYREEQEKWDKNVMPRTYSRSKASSKERSTEHENSGGKGFKTTTKSPRIPKTHPTEKVGLYLMDQPGVNINKMAQSLSTSNQQPQRFSMSTNPETDVTDYNMFPGMSPMKGSAFSKLDPFIRDVIVNKQQPGSESLPPKQNIGHGVNYKKTGQNMTYTGHSNKAYLTSHSAPVFEQEYNTNVAEFKETEGKLGGMQDRGSIPIAVPISSRTSESRDTVSSAPTVKELLTPLADRMERFRSMTEVKKTGAMRAINFDVAEGSGISNEGKTGEKDTGTPRVDLDDTYNMDLEGELDKLQYEASSEDTSTLSEVDDSQAVIEKTESTKEPENPNQSESRYSVTDYFMKYPQKSSFQMPEFIPEQGTAEQDHKENMLTKKQHIATEKTTKTAWQRAYSDGINDALNQVERLNLPSDEEEGKCLEKVIFSPNGIPMIFDDTNDEIESIEVNIDDEQIAAEFRSLRELSEKEHMNTEDNGSDSPQKHLYKGTDLDTSLSSINEGDSIGTATTTTSISSVDDRVFRQGLANLDANIARVQQSLRQKLY